MQAEITHTRYRPLVAAYVGHCTRPQNPGAPVGYVHSTLSCCGFRMFALGS